jgi:hypothetical protein
MLDSTERIMFTRRSRIAHKTMYLQNPFKRTAWYSGVWLNRSNIPDSLAYITVVSRQPCRRRQTSKDSLHIQTRDLATSRESTTQTYRQPNAQLSCRYLANMYRLARLDVRQICLRNSREHHPKFVRVSCPNLLPGQFLGD